MTQPAPETQDLDEAAIAARVFDRDTDPPRRVEFRIELRRVASNGRKQKTVHAA